MALAIVATVGSASANSYNTEAELDAAAAGVLPVPSWDLSESPVRILAAVNATAILDRMRFAGDRVDDTQALEWPREGVSNKRQSGTYLTTEIPADVKLAHARLTFFLAAYNPAVDPFVVQDAGVGSIAFGGELSMTFESGATSVSAGEQYVRTVIRPILGSLVMASQPGLVRG